MAFIAVYDANVLYPNTLRDLLIRIAQLPHLVQAKWTDEILDEMLRALRKNHPDVSDEKASILRERMNAAVRDCLVFGYEPLIDIGLGALLPELRKLGLNESWFRFFHTYFASMAGANERNELLTDLWTESASRKAHSYCSLPLTWPSLCSL